MCFPADVAGENTLNAGFTCPLGLGDNLSIDSISMMIAPSKLVGSWGRLALRHVVGSRRANTLPLSSTSATGSRR